MPRHFIPAQSSAHRIACIALYRALLLQCPRIPLPTEFVPRGPVNPLKHLVRKQFRRNQHVVSARLCVKALEVGYETSNLFQKASAGDETSVGKIHELLMTLQQKSQTSKLLNTPAIPPPSHPLSPINRETHPENYPVVRSALAPGSESARAHPHLTTRPRVWAFPGAPKLLERKILETHELPEGKKRQIPKLASANGIPFLRIKKPQPAYLSRFIRDRIKQREKRHGFLADAEEMVKLTRWEDAWDREMGVLGWKEGVGIPEGVQEGVVDGDGGGRWGEVVGWWRKAVLRELEGEQRRNREVADAMLGVVEEETRRKEMERVEAKKERNAMYWERRREREGENWKEKSEMGGKKKNNVWSMRRSRLPSSDVDGGSGII